MNNSKFYADRFRELAQKFTAPLDAKSQKAAVFYDIHVQEQAGNLFIEAVDSGHFRLLAGATPLVREFKDCRARSEQGEPVAFERGRCQSQPNAAARRAACASNLFLDVSGGQVLLEAFNEGGGLQPTRQLPPAGLLPDARPKIFPGAQFTMLAIAETDVAVAAEFRRLAAADICDRKGLACRLLAAILDAEHELKPDSGDGDASAVELLLDDYGREILAIAHRTDRSADERMRAIHRVDACALGWSSPKWSALLHVTEQAIRATPFWKVDRPRLTAPDD